ncbi:MAG: hypothetical protein WCB68_19910 [Pyrinomonadaceae bacterium]
MRSLSRFLLLTVLLGLTVAAHSATAQETKSFTLREGVGIGRVVVGVSTRKDVMAEFGGYVMLIGHDDTFEMGYDDIGVSFWYRRDDPRKRIIRITFEAPAEAVTTRGISLDKNTLRDAANIYGKTKLRILSCADSYYYEYPGIQFHVDYDFDNETESEVIEKKITQIVVVPLTHNPDPPKNKSKESSPCCSKTN